MERKSIVLQPYTHIAILENKHFWEKAINAFNHWIQVPQDKLDLITEVILLLHNATVIIDDIEDRSPMRRGVKSAHEVFGIPLTINAGNYVYFLALQKLQTLGNDQVVEIYTRNMLVLHEGQGCDIAYRDRFVWSYKNINVSSETSTENEEKTQFINYHGNFAWPTQSEYENVIVKKTTGLLSMAVELLCQFRGTNNGKVDEYLNLSERLGLCFQMWDDLKNIISPKLTAEKGFAADLDEGNFTFPIIHALNNSKFPENLFKKLQIKVKSVDVKQEILEILEESAAIQETRNRGQEILTSIKMNCDNFGQNPKMKEFLSNFFNITSFSV